MRRLEAAIARAEIVQTVGDLVRAYAELLVACERTGHALGQGDHDADRWIAFTALRLGVPLVSNDRVFEGFTSEQRLDDGVLEREFALGEIPGVLWTYGSAPAPLILSGHNGGLHKREPRLVARARHHAAEYGYAVAAIDHPGHGDRPRFAVDDQARADLRRAMEAGEPVDEIFESFIVPLVEMAVPEWRNILDALLPLPEIGGPVGYSGMTAIGIRLAVVEPRISAAGFFAGGFVPRAQREEARQVTIPLQFLLQWDDEGNDRQVALDLFDTFGTNEKTLHANVGGHTGTPWFEVDAGARFFDRHLK